MSRSNKIYHLIIFILALSVLTFGFSANAQTVPSVTTGSADMISARNVYLNASVNPNGKYTNVWFQIDINSPPIGVRGYQGAGSESSAVNVRAGIINLHLNTTYYYRVVAQNSGGIVYGEIRSFRTGSDSGSSSGSSISSNQNNYGYNSSYSSATPTIPGVPLVATNGPVSISSNSSVVNGSINPNGANTSFWFEFGLTQYLGQKTNVQSANNGNSLQLVTGNLSGLEAGRTYYYKVFAQNNYGASAGDIKSLTTAAIQTTGQSNGQVAEILTSTNGIGSSVLTNSTSKTAVTGDERQINQGTNSQSNTRPSFISLEYSLENENALVLVSDNIKPNPGEDFSYSIVYKNQTFYVFNEAVLKVIIPSEASYASSNIEPVKISGNIIEFNLGNIEPGTQGAVTVLVNIREAAVSGYNLIFTSVLGYKDNKGIQLTTTAYLMAKVNKGSSQLAASFLGSFLNSSGTLWLVALGLILLMGILTYGLVKVRKKNGLNGNGKENYFGLGMIPTTFEPITVPMDRSSFADPRSAKSFSEARTPMGRPDIFEPVRK